MNEKNKNEDADNEELDELYRQIQSGTESAIVPEAKGAREALRLIQRVRQQKTDLQDQSTAGTGQTLPLRDGLFDGPEIPESVGRFSIKRLLGKGGFGIVFLAHDPNLGRDIALKIPHAETVLNPQLKARFIREGRAAASLTHPNIVPVFESGQFGSICYLASLPIDGVPLTECFRDVRASNKEAAQIVCSIADGLAHAHQRGIIHRDIKPANVLVDADESTSLDARVQITDFGLAKDLSSEQNDTAPSDLIGTPAYMSPEQAQQKTADELSDVYAAGAVLYFLLTGEPPAKGSSILEIANSVVRDTPKSPSAINPNVNKDLQAICLKCLAKQPTNRYASAMELRDDLSRFLDGQPVIARPVSTGVRLYRWCSRNPGIAASLAAAVVLTGVAFAATLFGLNERNSALERELAAKQVEAEALFNEQAANQKAARHYADFKDAIDTYFVTVVENRELEASPGAAKVRKQLLSLALSYYQTYVREYRDDDDLAGDVAKAEQKLARILNIEQKYQPALEHARSAIQLLNEIDTVAGDDKRQKLMATSVVQEYEALRGMGRSKEASERIQLANKLLSEYFDKSGDYDVGLQLVESKMDEARTAQLAGDLTKAKQGYSFAQEVCRELQTKLPHHLLTADHPDVGRSRKQRLEASLLMIEGDLAIISKANGNDDESIEIRESCFEKWESLVSKTPNDWLYVKALVIEGLNLTIENFNLGQTLKAQEYLERTKKHIDRLVGLFPQNIKYRGFKGASLSFDAAIMGRLGDPAGGLRVGEENVKFARETLDQRPLSVEAQQALSRALGNHAVGRRLERVELDEAIDDVNEAIEICEKLIAQGTDNGLLSSKAILWQIKSALLVQTGRFADVEALAAKTLDICERMIAEKYQLHDCRNTKSAVLMDLGDASFGKGEFDAATRYWQQVIEMNVKGTRHRSDTARIRIALVKSRQDPVTISTVLKELEDDARDSEMSTRNCLEMARVYCAAENTTEDSETRQRFRKRAVDWITLAANANFFSTDSRVDYFWQFDEFSLLRDDPSIDALLVRP